MNVLKFGGSSVVNADAIQKVINIIIDTQKTTPKLFVVVSALGGITDALLLAGNQAAAYDETYKTTLSEIEKRHVDTAKKLIPVVSQSGVISKIKASLNQLEALCEGAYLLNELSTKTSAVISSFGELLSSFIISEAAKFQGVNATLLDSRDIITLQASKNLIVDYKATNENIENLRKTNQYDVCVFPGFIARTSQGEPTTLGRGGSDFTAAILAAAVSASQLQIWTDVSGVYTADPKVVRQAKPIPLISYKEAMELSHFGAKVIYPPTIQPVLTARIPILIKNTFAPDDQGTLITENVSNKQETIAGISSINKISLLSLEGSGMVGISGFSKRLFEILYQSEINIILITQASSEHSICLAIAMEDVAVAEEAINKAFELEITKGDLSPVKIENDVAIVALVGDQMYKHQGLSGKVFSALGRNNVNIRAIAQGASERNISVVINSKNINKALNCLHETFFEVETKAIHLFITGIGNVGGKLLEQIQQQQQFLRENLRLDLRVSGISNSRKMFFELDGIDLNNLEEVILSGETASIDGFFEKVKTLNLRNSIFIDNTANATVAKVYKKYLNHSIAVVTCNKIACADTYKNYEELKYLSRKFNTPFLYETNVGAGLPIIDTLNNLIASGDQIQKIQAVLSGSLNFVFNNYKEGTSFFDIVKQAQEEGYTEPDPKIDLSGIDVARKILILARESGKAIDLSDIINEPFLPEESLVTDSVSSFLNSIQENEVHFSSVLKEATDKDCRLKYVAQYENGSASVGLQHIPNDHPFYNLEGSDNIVLFYTNRYPEQPLIIKGAGAGAAVTASGIFADIIRVAKQN